MGSLFLTADDGMTGFLHKLSRRDDDTALYAGNFLLDEGVGPERRASYAAAGACADHAGFEDWQARHRG